MGVGLVASGLREMPGHAGNDPQSGDLRELTLMERRRREILRSPPAGSDYARWHCGVDCGYCARSHVADISLVLLFLPVKWLLDRMAIEEPRRGRVFLSFMALFVLIGVVGMIVMRQR